MNKHLCWEPQYAFEKIFTLTTRWQLVHLSMLALVERLSIPDLFIPEQIKKIRNIRCVASYEIIWKKEHGAIEMLKEYKELAKENDDDNVDNELLTSIEPQDLVSKCYPELVEAFENARSVKSKKRTADSRKKKKKTIATNVEDTNAKVKDIANSRQRKTSKMKNVQIKNNRKMEEFVSANPPPTSLEESFEKMAITPKRSKRGKDENVPATDAKELKRGPQFRRILETEGINSRLNNTIDRMFSELSPDDFMSENDDDVDLNMTDMIEDICSKRTFQFGATNGRQAAESTNEYAGNGGKCTKIDELIRSMEEHVHSKEEKEELISESDDEFGDINDSYVPINERIEIRERGQLLQKRDIEKNCNVNFEDLLNETDNKSSM